MGNPGDEAVEQRSDPQTRGTYCRYARTPARSPAEAEDPEPDDGSSFWEVRGETDRMHMRAKSFTNRKDADAHLQQLCAAGEIEIEGAGCGEW